MKSSRWMWRSLCALAPLAFAGCMYPGPYTYGTYPGYYAPPTGYAPPPGGTIVTPGPSFPSPQLGPAVTPTPAWTPSPSSPPSTLTPSPASPLTPLPSTPPGNSSFNDSQPTFGPSGARKPTDITVPTPIERGDPAPEMAPAGPSPRPTSSNTSPFGSDGSQGTFEKGAQITVPQRLDGPSHAVATVDPQSFESPIESQRRDRDGLVTVAGRSGSGAVMNGSDECDYDRTGYTWLRGKVDFDTHDHSWHIIYSRHPEPRDHYGGAFRLLDSPKLATLHDGDVVYIEGRVDTMHVDSRGKAQYRIEGDQITRIARGSATQSMGN